VQATEREAFHERLIALRQRLIESASQTLSRFSENFRQPGDLSDVPTHAADHDSESADPEIEVETSREQIIEAIDVALERIEQGTYGECETCGREIGRRRLQALPYATECIECARRRDQE
jgi:DnaK suppressor protein